MTAAKKPAPLMVAAPDPALADQLREVLAAAQQRMAIAAIAAPERAAEPGAAAAGCTKPAELSRPGQATSPTLTCANPS